MKKLKKYIVGAAALLVGIGLAAPSNGIVGSAESEKTYRVEYASEIILPMPELEASQAYKVQVFAKADSEFANPLPVNGYTFTPDGIGEYVLRYLLNDGGVESYLYYELVVADETEPTFTIDVKKTYAVGDTVTFSPKINDNTAKWCTVTHTLFKDGVNVTGQIKGGKITFTEAGNYKMRVKVTDAGGNSKAEVYTFTVGGAQGGEDDSPLGLILGIGGAVVAVGVITTLVIVRKKKAKSDGKINREGGEDA